jgi:uncharacterized SAM-binding protein YcdF (DUF218 family)
MADPSRAGKPGFAVLLVAPAGLVVGLSVVAGNAPARALILDEVPGQADAILVLGGDPHYERTRTAVELYDQGLAPVVIFSGAGYSGEGASYLAREARRFGLPAAAAVLEEAAQSTRENMVFAARLVRKLGVRRLILVSSPIHMLRATLAARRAMPETTVIPVAAHHASYTVENWRRKPSGVVREYIKLTWYVLRGWV